MELEMILNHFWAWPASAGRHPEKPRSFPEDKPLNTNANFHSRGTRRLRRLRDILLDGRNRLFRFMSILVGNISAQHLGESAAIIGEDENV
jgi:hypothetical protein